MEERLKKLEEEISLIRERNKKVEADKSWEVSKIRTLSILLLTYIFVSIVLFFIGVENYLLSAVIPVLGFFLSTLSLPFIKRWWVRNL